MEEARARLTEGNGLGAEGLGSLRCAADRLADTIRAPRHDHPSCKGLAYPPGDGAQFQSFADAAAGSERIVSLLA